MCENIEYFNTLFHGFHCIEGVGDDIGHHHFQIFDGWPETVVVLVPCRCFDIQNGMLNFLQFLQMFIERCFDFGEHSIDRRSTLSPEDRQLGSNSFFPSGEMHLTFAEIEQISTTLNKRFDLSKDRRLIQPPAFDGEFLVQVLSLEQRSPIPSTHFAHSSLTLL